MATELKQIRILISLAIIICSCCYFVIDVYWLNSIFRVPIGLLCVSFFPGYAALKALLPDREDEYILETIVFSIVGSILIVSFTAFGLAYSPWGFRLDPIIILLTIMTVSLSIGGILRRRGTIKIIPSLNQIFIALIPTLESNHNNLKPVNILFHSSILAFLIIATFALFTPSRKEPFTSFYIPDIKKINLSNVQSMNTQLLNIPVGIENNEKTDMTYSLQVYANKRDSRVELINYPIFVEKNSVVIHNLILNEIPSDTKSFQINLLVTNELKPYRSLQLTMPDK